MGRQPQERARGETVRGRTLRDLLALSGREYKVLHQVARWPLLRSTGLALLAGYSGNSDGMILNMLQRLQTIGLIRTVRVGHAKARLWPAEYVESDGRRVVDLHIARLLLAWKDTLLTNEFFLGLRRLAEKEQEMERNHQLLIWDSVECRRWFWDADGRQLLLPDSRGVYRIGDEVYEFWLEIDRGHSVAAKHGKALRRKYERYYLYRRHPDAIWGRSMPRVLVVTPQIGRAPQVLDGDRFILASGAGRNLAEGPEQEIISPGS